MHYNEKYGYTIVYSIHITDNAGKEGVLFQCLEILKTKSTRKPFQCMHAYQEAKFWSECVTITSFINIGSTKIYVVFNSTKKKTPKISKL